MSFNQGAGLPYSANPLQKFTNLTKARSAARSGAYVAAAYAAWATLGVLLLLLTESRERDALELGLIAAGALLGVGAILILAWRIWVRPGPIKNGIVLLLCLTNLMAPSIISIGVALAMTLFAVVALRASLALPKLAKVGSLDQFS